jgi:ArsR family transcriptional regulator, arsenate/arsenite/antimonite-responsive transcriptional repressor
VRRRERNREVSEEMLSRAFRAIGHPHRLTIMLTLLDRAVACRSADHADACERDPASCNVGELATLVDIAPSTLSHHLKELRDAGVIERARDGRFLYCRVNEALLDELVGVLGGTRSQKRARRRAS